MSKKKNKDMDKYIITAGQENQRLDKTLASFLPSLARNQIQKLIKAGQILVDGRVRSAHYLCRLGNEIRVWPEADSRAAEQKGEAVNPESVAIIKKTDEYLVVNKPAGIAVHGPGAQTGSTLIDRLLKKFPEIARVGEEPDRPGIVHRLDKEASGLMVVARTKASYFSLKNQFKKRQIKKEYFALVYGCLNRDQDTINFPLARSRSGGKTAALPLTFRGEKTAAGRPSETDYEIFKRYHNFTLVKVRTRTGRMHQIRAHFAAYGHPLAGDDLYGTKKTRIKNKKLAIGRVFLVANKLLFTDLAGEKQKFTITLPKELKNFLGKIK